MTAHPGFLVDIIEHPDDTPRLIYADWLEEHGEVERAEFIRVQVELARMDEAGEGEIDPNEGHTCFENPCLVCANVARYRHLRQREDALLNGTPGWFEWLGRATLILGFTQPYNEVFTFRRGFITDVRCPLAAWLQHGPALAAAHPVEIVRLTDREPRQIVDEYEWCLCHPSSRTAQAPHRLPREFYGEGSFHPLFPTPEAAHAWASERAILWARGKLLSKGQRLGAAARSDDSEQN
jgi:uncharacterized protein (TIGR02996 family)